MRNSGDRKKVHRHCNSAEESLSALRASNCGSLCPSTRMSSGFTFAAVTEIAANVFER